MSLKKKNSEVLKMVVDKDMEGSVASEDYGWTTGDSEGVVPLKFIADGGHGEVHQVMNRLSIYRLLQMSKCGVVKAI